MEINNQNVEIFYDLIDEACMIHYEDINMDYLEALSKVTSDLLDNFNDDRISEDAIVKLNDIYDKIYNLDCLNEEIRLALVLIIIKGLKHRGLQLDVVTPDTINYLISYIIQNMFDDEEFTMVDTAMGIGNLSAAILNNLDNKINLIGIEEEESFVGVSKSLCDLLYHDASIYFQKFEDKIFDLCDLVIGDLDRTNDPYQVILERLDNLNENGKFIYLINNDFFSSMKDGFKEALEKSATLMGLIVLPDNMVNDKHVGKSLLIGKKAVLNDFHMGILKIDNFDPKSIGETFKNIKRMIEQMEVK